jgi:hypothetical protein
MPHSSHPPFRSSFPVIPLVSSKTAVGNFCAGLQMILGSDIAVFHQTKDLLRLAPLGTRF